MKQQQLAILFWISRNRIKNGKAPLWVRITISGERKEISVQREVSIIEWDPKSQTITSRSREAKEINDHLTIIKGKLLSCQSKLEARGEIVTVQKLKDEYDGVVEKPRMIIPIFKQHNEDIKCLIGNGYARGTWIKFCTLLRHLEDFLLSKHNEKDINIKSINREFLYDFELYLRSQKKIDLNTTAKYLQGFKKILTSCVNMDWLAKNPFAGYKFKTKIVDREILSENELKTIHEKTFLTERLNIVKDIFLFSCYTGLAYIDVFNLNSNNITTSIDGKKWIYTNRQKTNIASHIPILPPALAILEKYASYPDIANNKRALPVLSNQKMNAYLKEIASCCGITKELTFHMARHTFATTVTMSNGVPIESISKMLGHTRLQTTQHYAKILDSKVSADMQGLFNKYNDSSTTKETLVIAK